MAKSTPGVIFVGEQTLNPKATLELKVSEINRINRLIDRAEKKPMMKYTYSDGREIGCCPNCEKVLLGGDCYEYCPHCGQHYDNKTYGL